MQWKVSIEEVTV